MKVTLKIANKKAKGNLCMLMGPIMKEYLKMENVRDKDYFRMLIKLATMMVNL